MQGGITVTVQRPPDRDRRTGDPVPGTGGTHQLAGVGFDPGGSHETDELGNRVTTQPTLYSDDYGADVLAIDTITIPGDSTPWYVDGDPARWQNPHTGRKRGCVIKLTRTKG